jgi:hypothetical protein
MDPQMAELRFPAEFGKPARNEPTLPVERLFIPFKPALYSWHTLRRANWMPPVVSESQLELR